MVTTKKTAIENIQKEMRKEFKHLTIKTQLNTKKKTKPKIQKKNKRLIQEIIINIYTSNDHQST